MRFVRQPTKEEMYIKRENLAIALYEFGEYAKWFNDEAGASLLGIPLRTYQDNVKKVLDNTKGLRGDAAKTLKIHKTGLPKRYVNFFIIFYHYGSNSCHRLWNKPFLKNN